MSWPRTEPPKPTAAKRRVGSKNILQDRKGHHTVQTTQRRRTPSSGAATRMKAELDAHSRLILRSHRHKLGVDVHTRHQKHRSHQRRNQTVPNQLRQHAVTTQRTLSAHRTNQTRIRAEGHQRNRKSRTTPSDGKTRPNPQHQYHSTPPSWSRTRYWHRTSRIEKRETALREAGPLRYLRRCALRWSILSPRRYRSVPESADSTEAVPSARTGQTNRPTTVVASRKNRSSPKAYPKNLPPKNRATMKSANSARPTKPKQNIKVHR